MSELKLEAGKTYVFVDDETKDKFIENHSLNKIILNNYYTDGFTLTNSNDETIEGFINGQCVINLSELKYFKLKEENKMLKPDDKITIEMTALEATKLCALTGRVHQDTSENYQSDIYKKLKDELGVNSRLFMYLTFQEVRDWQSESPLTKVAMSIFEPEPNLQQDKIDELEVMIKQAVEELAKLKSEG